MNIPKTVCGMPVKIGLTAAMNRVVTIGPWRMLFYKEGGDCELELLDHSFVVTEDMPRRVRRAMFKIKRLRDQTASAATAE